VFIVCQYDSTQIHQVACSHATTSKWFTQREFDTDAPAHCFVYVPPISLLVFVTANLFTLPHVVSSLVHYFPFIAMFSLAL